MGISEHAVAPRAQVKHPRAAVTLLVALLSLFVGGGLYSGWIFLSTVRALLEGEPMPRAGVLTEDGRLQVPLIPVPGAKPQAKPQATAVGATPTAIPEEPLPIWDGKDRVTILLLGIDQREDERDLPTRSDTMILVTMDPINLTAGMLSLPRDLWVPIPGHGENKLNTAHFFGESDKPGSGPQTARRTIQYNLGVPINYTARVDFSGFERLVDAVGGITVDVDRAILDNEYPNESYGITRLFVAAGPQRMSGRTALRYARSRHSDSDFGRIRRQQKVLHAAREQALALNLVTVTRLPQIIGIVTGSVATDIPLRDMPALANLGRQIPSHAIASRHVDDSMIIDVNRDGTILIPDREKIRQVVNELFYSPAVKQEAARIEVLNGTGRDGLASNVRAALQAQGIAVQRVDSADRANYATSMIVDRGGKPATAKHLAALLRLPASAIRTEGGGAGDADVTVILGSDFRGP